MNIGQMKTRASISPSGTGLVVECDLQRKPLQERDHFDQRRAGLFLGPITTRYGNQIINKVGEPLGSFYGYIADGLFKDAADVAAMRNRTARPAGSSSGTSTATAKLPSTTAPSLEAPTRALRPVWIWELAAEIST